MISVVTMKSEGREGREEVMSVAVVATYCSCCSYSVVVRQLSLYSALSLKIIQKNITWKEMLLGKEILI